MAGARRWKMPASCPDCGAEVEYTSEPARLLTGTCGACHHEFTIVGGHVDWKRGGGAGSPEESDVSAAPKGVQIPGGPACPDCGAPTVLRVTSGRSIESKCSDCQSTMTFVLSDGARPPPSGRDAPDRPWRDEGARRAPSAGRPCRQCGAPLTFTTGDDGLLTGECSQCGNRFTLPARRDSAGPRGDRPQFGRGRPSGYSGGRRFTRGSGSGRPPRFERRGQTRRRFGRRRCSAATSAAPRITARSAISPHRNIVSPSAVAPSSLVQNGRAGPTGEIGLS